MKNQSVLFVAILILAILGCSDKKNPTKSTNDKGTILGEVHYTGSLSQVSSNHPMAIAIYSEDNIQLKGQPLFMKLLTTNPENYSFEVDLGSYQACVVFDSNGDGVWDGDHTTPYEIYNNIFTFNGSSLKIRVLTAGGQYTVNFDFDDSHLK
jgi:hypothetical protein